MKFLLLFFLFIAVPLQSFAEKIDGIAAVVNDNAITLSELQEAQEASKGFSDQGKTPSRKETLEHMIENLLMKEEATKLGVEVSETEVDEAVAEVRARNGLDEEQFRVFILSRGMEFEDYREEIRREIEKAKLANQVLRSRLRVGDEALKNHYLKNVADFAQPEKLRLSHILLPKDADQTMADDIRGRLAAGEAFSDLARDLSEGSASEKGGDLGYIASSDLSQEIKTAVEGKEAGAVVGPVSIGGRLHMFKIEDKVEGKALSFEEAKDKVRDKYFKDMEEELYRGWMDSLKAKARIERRL